MRRTPVYIVCSTRPAVGKTLLARLLTEFLKLQRRTVRAFDVSLKEPSLIDYLPGVTEAIDISATTGKMALVDQLILHDDVAKVVDLGFHAFDEFFVMSREIGFFHEAALRNVAPLVLFVADTDRSSLHAYAQLAQQLSRDSFAVVDNLHVLRGELPAEMRRSRVVQIGILASYLMSYIDKPGFSFTEYLRTETDKSADLHRWVERNYALLRDLELQLTSGRP
jgi:hypothetical protein